MPTVGISIGLTALVGQWIGRRDIAAAKRRTYVALKLGMGYMLMMAVFFFLFRERLISLFRTDPEVVRIGSTILIVAAVCQIFDAISIVMRGALKGAGDTRWVAIFTVGYAWLVFVPTSYLFAFRLDLGAPGAWVGAALYIFCLGVTLLWRFHSEKWLKIDIFGESGDSVSQ
jgi:Na+-driven multidrug efflux pump